MLPRTRRSLRNTQAEKFETDPSIGVAQLASGSQATTPAVSDSTTKTSRTQVKTRSNDAASAVAGDALSMAVETDPSTVVDTKFEATTPAVPKTAKRSRSKAAAKDNMTPLAGDALTVETDPSTVVDTKSEAATPAVPKTAKRSRSKAAAKDNMTPLAGDALTVETDPSTVVDTKSEAATPAAPKRAKRSRSKATAKDDVTPLAKPEKKKRLTKEEADALRELKKQEKEAKQQEKIMKAAAAAEAERAAEEEKKKTDKIREQKLKKLRDLEDDMTRERLRRDAIDDLDENFKESPTDDEALEVIHKPETRIEHKSSSKSSKGAEALTCTEVARSDDCAPVSKGPALIRLNGTASMYANDVSVTSEKNAKKLGDITNTASSVQSAHTEAAQIFLTPPSDDIVVYEEVLDSRNVEIDDANIDKGGTTQAVEQSSTIATKTNSNCKRKLSQSEITIDTYDYAISTTRDEPLDNTRSKRLCDESNEKIYDWRAKAISSSGRPHGKFLSVENSSLRVTLSRSPSPRPLSSDAASSRGPSPNPTTQEDDSVEHCLQRSTSETPIQAVVGASLSLKSDGRGRRRIKQEPNDDSDIIDSQAKTKKYTMKDIPVDSTMFRYSYIPSVFDYTMSRMNPFLLRDNSLIDPYQKLWDKVFPDHKMMITMDCPVKFVGDQRIMEYRRRFADTADKCTEALFVKLQRENPKYDDLWRMEYVERAKCNKPKPDFVFKTFPLDNVEIWDKRGVFMNPIILEILALHLQEIKKAHPEVSEVQDSQYPIGALALATTAYERALNLWMYGSPPTDEDKSNAAFSADKFSGRTMLFAEEAKLLEGFHWRRIINGASEFIPKYANGRSRSVSPAFVKEEEDVAEIGMSLAAMDQDSDSESE